MKNSSEDAACETEGSSLVGESIGGGRSDFEAVLLDGCFGFGLSSAVSVFVLFGAFCTSPSLGEDCLLALLAAATAALALRAGQILTDRLQTDAGEKIIKCGYAVSCVTGVVLLGFGFRVGAVTAAGLGLVFAVFLYGHFLASLIRGALAFVFDTMFMAVGIVFLVISQLEAHCSFAVIAVLAGFSVAVSLLFARKERPCRDIVDASESKSRSIDVKGNNQTLFLLGFMFAGGILALFVGQPFEIVALALGGAVSFAGMASLLLGRMDERLYKEALKKSCALMAALLLLPIPVLPSMWQLVFLSMYLCYVSLNVIVMLNAVVETTRFNQIAPIWLFGQEGSVFCLGIAAGCVLLREVAFFRKTGPWRSI